MCVCACVKARVERGHVWKMFDHVGVQSNGRVSSTKGADRTRIQAVVAQTTRWADGSVTRHDQRHVRIDSEH